MKDRSLEGEAANDAAAGQETHKLPTTLISGFLGSGKTTLLKHILRNTHGLRCAVIVNDMAELNIDAALLKNSRLVQTDEGFVELSNGCICCTLRDDFVAEISALAQSGKYDYLVIESTGIAEPMQVAEAFAVDMVDSGKAAGDGAKPALHDLVRLDTCVTVLDAANIMDNLASLESVKERGKGEATGGGVEEEEERHISDLLLDGIEFAEVILLNKVDLVTGEEVKRLLALLRALNPNADIIPTHNSVVDLGRVMGTHRFSFDKAARAPGWLKTLQEGAVMTPETLEYNIGNFVYRSRRPFHPQRLHDFISGYALLQEPDWQEEEEGEGHQCEHPHHHHHHSHDHHHHHIHKGDYGREGVVKQMQHSRHHPFPALPALQPNAAGGAPGEAVSSAVAQASAAAHQAAQAVQELAGQLAQQQQQQQSMAQLQANAAALAAAAAAASAAAASAAAASLLACQLQSAAGAGPASISAQQPAKAAAGGKAGRAGSATQPSKQPGALGGGGFGQVLRSKGFIWLASRPDLYGEWSQAGGILQLGVGGPWYCVLPDSEWPEEEEKRAEIRADFREPHGDRRQELVFIGIDIDQAKLCAALDACLASVEELEQAQEGQLHDPFAAWPTLQELLEDGEDDDEVSEGLSEDEGDQEGSDEGWPAPAPGRVHEVSEGAAEVQALLDDTSAQALVLSWHARWCAPCEALAPALGALAARHADSVLVLRLDVEASAANEALALEKVMERPSSRRIGAKPVLRGEEKFPCITLHYPPSLQPAAKFTGPTALASLQAELQNSLMGSAPTVPAARGTAAASSSKPSADPTTAAAPATPAVYAALPNGGSITGPSRYVVLKKGAAQAQELLKAAQASGTAVLVMWTQPEDEDCQALVAAAEESAKQSRGLVLVEACPAVSAANGVLAKALKVSIFPTLHLYRSMKLSASLEGPEKATPQALADMVAQAQQAAQVQAAPTPHASAAATAATPAPAAEQLRDQQAQQEPQQAPQAAGSSIYDPPSGKYAKPGATKHMDDGKLVHFFPKMPCLKCGCPWWTSDEWDARCIRCGWDCESGGYDDNSQPLPKYKQRWEQFIAYIKEGRAAPYTKRSKQ